jgi:hypothetical protein
MTRSMRSCRPSFGKKLLIADVDSTMSGHAPLGLPTVSASESVQAGRLVDD